MTYVPSHTPWEPTDYLTTTAMNNFETIYDETYNGCLITHNHDTLYEVKSAAEAKYYWSGNMGPTSGADADLIQSSVGPLHASQLAGYSAVPGLIIMWYGSIASIPTGWALCNGLNGTRDLRDKFVMGPSTTNPVGTVGGSNTINPNGTLNISTHTLTIDELGPHVHPFLDRCVLTWGSDGWNGGTQIPGDVDLPVSGVTIATGGGSAHGHSAAEGTAAPSANASQMPYYYALAFIMKLSN